MTVAGRVGDPFGEHPEVALDVDIRDVDTVRLAAAYGVRYRPRARALPLTLAGRITGVLGRQVEATGLSGRIDAYYDAKRFSPTSFNGTFQARGRSQAELVSSLRGQAKLSGYIRPGKRVDAGIALLIACTGLTNKLGKVLASVLGDFAKDQGPLSGVGVFGEYLDLATLVLANGVGDVSGDIRIDNGQVVSRNIQIISRQGGGRAFIAGDVALPQYTVWGQIELRTPESDKYSQQVGRHEPYLVADYAADLDGNDKRTRLDGLFNDRNFKQTNCPGGLLDGGGKLGEMLGTVLGRQPASAQPQPGQQPATPQDQLKELLGGLRDLLKKQ